MNRETLLHNDDHKAFANYYHNILKPQAQKSTDGCKTPTKYLAEALRRLEKDACDQQAYKLLATIELTKGKDTPEKATDKVSEIYQNLFSGNNFANLWATLKRAHNIINKLQEKSEHDIKEYLLDLALAAQSRTHINMVFKSIGDSEINKNAGSLCALAIKHHVPELLTQILEFAKMKQTTQEDIIFLALESNDPSILEVICSKPEFLAIIKESLPQIHELTIAADAAEILNWLLNNQQFADYIPSVKELLRLSVENDSPESARVVLQKFQGTQQLCDVLSGTEQFADKQSIWHIAAATGNLQILIEFINTCSEHLQEKVMHHEDKDGFSILHYAAEKSDLSFIKLFTQMTGFLEALTYYSKSGITPLLMLAEHYGGDYEKLLHTVAEQIDTDCGLLDAIESKLQNQQDAKPSQSTKKDIEVSICSDTDSEQNSLINDSGHSSFASEGSSPTDSPTRPKTADIDKLLQDMRSALGDTQDSLPDSDRRESATSDTSDSSFDYSINSLPTNNLITCQSPFEEAFGEWWNN